MRTLLAEYTVSHEPTLALEGAAMLSVLSSSFKRSGYDVVIPEDGDFGDEISYLAPSCDFGLVIAPDHLLPKYTMIIEQYSHNIGCGSMNAAICANKVKTAKILREHGILVPEEIKFGLRVIKPVTGCGSQGVRLSDQIEGKDEFGQEYIKGDYLSVSLIASRVVGEACLYFSGISPLVLAINRQNIKIDGGGVFHYLGGETPIDHPRSDEIIQIAQKTVSVLGCQGYCGVDVIVSDKVYVVDVNPRITTSLIGITACMKEEIAELLVSASKGNAPDHVHLTGKVRFNKNGKVVPI
jgi:predicted ATP-grasp superfamily ATP-dependent carboligase